MLDSLKYPVLKDFSLKILSLFGSTYVCESTFSLMKTIKSKERNRMLDGTLKTLLRSATTSIQPDFQALVNKFEESSLLENINNVN